MGCRFRNGAALLALATGAWLGTGCERTKEKVTAPSTVVQVSPARAEVAPGQPQTFQAATVNGADVSAQTQWALNPPELGTLSATEGSQVVFTASSTAAGKTGTLVASVNGVTATCDIVVVSTGTGGGGGGGDGGGGGGGGTVNQNVYAFFSETSDSLGMKLDTPNPPDPDGGFLGVFQGTDQGGTGTIQLTSSNQATEGNQSLHVTGTLPDVNSFGGIFFVYGFPITSPSSIKTRDLSAFANGTLKFDFFGHDFNDVLIKLESASGSDATSPQFKLKGDLNVPFGENFTSVSIPLSQFTSRGLNLSQFRGITFSVTGAVSGVGTCHFGIDNLRLEK